MTEPAAVAVLGDVARDTADWPDALLVVAGPDHAELWHGTGLPVWPDRSAALVALGTPDATQRMNMELEPVVGAARRSGELVTEAWGSWSAAPGWPVRRASC